MEDVSGALHKLLPRTAESPTSNLAGDARTEAGLKEGALEDLLRNSGKLLRGGHLASLQSGGRMSERRQIELGGFDVLL